MGINGLETFLDSFYGQSQQSKFINKELLSSIKFVIDANQLPHVICRELNCNNQYGGNYDEIYSKAKEILVALKPFIAKMIFDGSKEDPIKAIGRFADKIYKIANLPTKWKPNPCKNEQYEALTQHPPFFIRMIIFDLVKELNINYSMSNGMADHAVACFANGFNEESKYYTVLSRDSYFYAYDLKKGYLSFKYLIEKLKDSTNLNALTEVPVFNVKSLLHYFELASYKTWIYFCILMGDSDQGINRNIAYFRAKQIDTRYGNWTNLIKYLKGNEGYLLQSDFNEIRSTYSSGELNKIDALIKQFEFKDNEFTLIDATNDFDRFAMSVKDLKICFLNTMVEDCTNKTVFEMCQENNILKELYSKITDHPVREYSRLPIENSNDTPVQITLHPSSRIESSSTLAYLNKLNATKTNLNDELSLFYASLAFWESWLEKKEHSKQIESSKIFVEAIITNFIVIMLKTNLAPGTKRCDCLWKLLCPDGQDFSSIVDLYNQIIKDVRNKDDFFKNDLKIVHRINEFQAGYYLISTYSRLLKYNFEFLGAEKFLNGLFVCRYIQQSETKDSNAFKLSTLLKSNNNIQAAVKEIWKDLDEIKASTKIVELIDLIGAIQINK